MRGIHRCIDATTIHCESAMSILKGLSRLWLRSVARAGKVQQKQTKQLLKSLTVKPKFKARAKPKPVKRSGTTLAGAKTTGKTRALSAPTRPKADAGLANLPGKWLASYYSSLADGRTLPARRLSYNLYLPVRGPAQQAAGNQEAKTWPLIVMLHGCEQTAAQFSQGTRMNQLAEQKGYAVLYPQQSLRSHPNRCWKWYDKPTQEGGGDVEMIVGMIEKVLEKYSIDRTRIYLCGISAGAAMANIVALNHPHLIAAIGLHSAPLFGAGHSPISGFGVMQLGASSRVVSAVAEVLHKCPEFPQMPAILIQGRGDKIVRPINQAQLAQQCRLLNRLAEDSALPLVVKPASRAGSRNSGNAYDIRDFYQRKKLLLRVIQIAGLEHAWSGGDGRLAFNSSAGPDASKLMLAFFARHRRINPIGFTPLQENVDNRLRPPPPGSVPGLRHA
jgi:poly(hydroxyalkanoate) depolymerase family esterase